MAYRYEKNPNTKESELVFDGWENGIADSPYVGVANMRNLDTRYYGGVAYVNYKRLPATTNTGSFTLNAPVSAGTTSTTLSAIWTLPSGTYATTFSTGEVRNVLYTNGSLTISWTPGLTSNETTAITIAGVIGKPTFSAVDPTGLIYILDDLGQVWAQSSVSSNVFNLLQGSPTSGAQGQGIAWWQNCLVVFRNSNIDICGTGQPGGITSSNWNCSGADSWLPIGNISTMTLKSAVAAGDQNSDIATYTDQNGNNHSNGWFGANGTFQVTFSSGEKTIATFVYNSGQGDPPFDITYNPPPQIGGTSSITVQALIPASKHMAIVSRNDGILYFCNGPYVGSLSANNATFFSPCAVDTFTFNVAALDEPLPKNDTSVWLEEFQNYLLIAGNNLIYPWNRISSSSFDTPIPVQEPISKMINILNVIYIFAGQKGNIYYSNGGSAYLLKKIPDYISGVIDPIWSWGGIMGHRGKLYFQAMAQQPGSGTNILAGIFSLTTTATIYSETANSLNLESQNSFGLISTTTQPPGLLIDNTPSNGGYDSYFSAWTNGIGDVGGIDYNNTTLWSNNEPIIETDIVPIGTYVEPHTFNNIEFKLDREMLSGDSISVYARGSLTDSYVFIGTTTTNVLSDFYSPLPFEKYQWLQLMITMSCGNPSSFIPLREIRVR